MSKAAAQSETRLLDGRQHLHRVEGRLMCRFCKQGITVDAQTGVEYGHARKRYGKLPEVNGRCPHRPAGVDPHGGFHGP